MGTKVRGGGRSLIVFPPVWSPRLYLKAVSMRSPNCSTEWLRSLKETRAVIRTCHICCISIIHLLCTVIRPLLRLLYTIGIANYVDDRTSDNDRCVVF